MLKFFCQFVLMACLPFSGAVHAAKVLFLNPGKANETFWVSYSQFMQTAANELGLELQIQYGQRIPERSIMQAREALQGPDRPDYLVFTNEQYIAPQILRLSQGSGVKLFIVNNPLSSEQASRIGAQAAKVSGLIGSMATNDEEGGYLMLKELLRQHGPLKPDQTLGLLAFSGVKNTPASILREKGMQRALKEHPQVRLRQKVYGQWSQQRAYDQALKLFKRYPGTKLVWAANDEMAFGAMRAASETGRIPGRDVLFSAVNSSIPALEARMDGRLSALVAGHFTLGGWAMVLLSDDSKGIDTARYGGRDRLVPVLQLIEPEQAGHLLQAAHQNGIPLTFADYSAQGKPPSYRYPFSIQTVLQALAP